MFDKLQELPLFIGLGPVELLNIVEQIKMEFNKLQSGYFIAEQGERCDKAIYILNGDTRITRDYASPILTTSEELHVTEDDAFLIELPNLWGVRPEFRHSYMTLSEVHTLTIDKQSLLQMVDTYPIIRANLINMITGRLHKCEDAMAEQFPRSVEEKFRRFVLTHLASLRSSSATFQVRMEDLATYINEPRIAVSRVLNSLAKEGLAILVRGSFHIPDIDKLLSKLK